MPTRRTKAELESQAVLDQCDIIKPPVPVEALARHLGAKISFEPFAGNVSGMLYRDGKRAIIGVNTLHPEVRQRFTVAHEIGHLRLHGKTQVFIDRLVRVDFRDDRSSTATDQQEIQANAFAAALLMPAQFVMSEIAKRGVGVDDSVHALVGDLANAFNVSEQAMEYRLVNLGIRGHI
jgi:Zn-dependent peptidase ImmA (M78 family)